MRIVDRPSHVGVAMASDRALRRGVLRWDYFVLRRGARDDALVEQSVRERETTTARGPRSGRAGTSSSAAADALETNERGSDVDDGRMIERARARTVPMTFRSAREYAETFEPLLFAECAAIARRGEDVEREERRGGGRTRAARVKTTTRSDEFHLVTFELSEADAMEFYDDDLVFVSKADAGDASEAELKKCEERAGETHALGIVDGRDAKTCVRVRMYLPDASSGDSRSTQGETKLDASAALAERDAKRFRSTRNALMSSKHDETWYLKNIAALSTITREWRAVHELSSLPYASTILKGAPAAEAGAPAAANAWAISDALRNVMEHAYNESQVKAMSTALSQDPFVLIQGPPGTGKTRTILSLLSVLLHSVPSTSSRTTVDFASYAEIREAREKMSSEQTRRAWRLASPWLNGVENPRDAPPTISLASGGEGVAKPPSKRKVIAQSLGTHTYKRSKILICAPSNSALDEIVLRIMRNGLVDGAGATYSPTIVRVGVNVHHSVKQVHMDTLISQRLGELGAHLDSVRRFEAAIERDRLKQAILEEASVVCSTLSFSGSGMFSRMSKTFDAVIIDEAAQAVEPSTLIPLCSGAKQVFLVGDPRQLPATVLNSIAIDHGYDTSMFKRFQSCGYPVHVLKTQYRMHPSIRVFPSMLFYDNELIDGPGLDKLTTRRWHKHSVFRPFVFFDVKGKERASAGHSWVNDEESEFIVALVQTLFARFPELIAGEHVAVISPYKAQVRNIRRLIKEKLGAKKALRVDVNTIDGFQGHEKDICIFSVVRAPKRGAGSSGGGLGFVADERRINVGLTRARSSLFVVGAAESIKGDDRWGSLVESARRRNCALTPSKPYRDFLNKHSAVGGATETFDDEEVDAASKLGEAASVVAEEGADANMLRTHIWDENHVHDPHWSGAAEFIRSNDLVSGDGGFSKDGFRDELIVENTKKGEAVGGDDDMLMDVEDGDDANRDEFTEAVEEPAKKKPTRRSTRA